jgi:hypothetical protein
MFTCKCRMDITCVLLRQPVWSIVRQVRCGSISWKNALCSFTRCSWSDGVTVKCVNVEACAITNCETGFTMRHMKSKRDSTSDENWRLKKYWKIISASISSTTSETNTIETPDQFLSGADPQQRGCIHHRQSASTPQNSWIRLWFL